jgi:UDP-glucose 4-epimerase
MNSKKIIVTGSSGTIGTPLCKRLISEGYDVIPIDLQKNKWDENIDRMTLKIDLRYENKIRELPKADFVVHLAANSRVPESVSNPALARDNFLTTFNMLEYCRLNNSSFIFSSSREAYGEGEKQHYEEKDVVLENCANPYGASKISGESIVHAYRKCYNIGAVIVRLSNVYGCYDEYDRVIPTFIRKMLNNEHVTIFNGNKTLDFIHNDDVVQAFLLCIKNFELAKGRTLNIATGKGVTLNELANLICTATNTKSNIIVKENRTGEVMHYVADISQAQKVLGFSSSVDIVEGIKKAVEWYSKIHKY